MRPQTLLRLWQTATLVIALIALTLLVLNLVHAPRLLGTGAQGFLAYDAEPARFKGWVAHRIRSLEPESPLAAAGVQVGDLIVDPPRGTLLAGEAVELRIARDDREQR